MDENEPTRQAPPDLTRIKEHTQCPNCGAIHLYHRKASLYDTCRSCGRPYLNLPVRSSKQGLPHRVPATVYNFLGFLKITVPLGTDTPSTSCLLCQGSTARERWAIVMSGEIKSPGLHLVGPICRECVDANLAEPFIETFTEPAEEAIDRPSDAKMTAL